MAATDVCCLFNGIPALAFTLQCAHSRRSSGVAILMAAPSELENLGRNYNRLRGDLGICKAYQLTWLEMSVANIEFMSHLWNFVIWFINVKTNVHVNGLRLTLLDHSSDLRLKKLQCELPIWKEGRYITCRCVYLSTFWHSSRAVGVRETRPLN